MFKFEHLNAYKQYICNVILLKTTHTTAIHWANFATVLIMHYIIHTGPKNVLILNFHGIFFTILLFTNYMYTV